MEHNETACDLLRLAGFMAVCVGVAWALQILGLSAEGTAFSRLLWVTGAASIAGAGVGAILTARNLREREATVHI